MPKQAVIVSKDSLKYTPLGPFMMLSGSVFINRGNSAAAVKRLDEAGNLIKHNKVSTWIFPEGTRHLSPKSDMLPLKKGGFHLAIGAGIPIIPIVVENYYHIYHSGFFGEGTIKVKGKRPCNSWGRASLMNFSASSSSNPHCWPYSQGRRRPRCARSRTDG